jgi:anti-sigma factor RsiW
MNPHLTPQQIAEWITGDKIAEVDQHLRDCPECAAAVNRLAEPLALFRTTVRALGEEMGPAPLVLPAELPRRASSPLHWRLAMATAAAVTIAAIPIARHLRPVHEAPAPAPIAHISDDALLRQVESDLSRSVPTPMEPLAKLMAEDWRTK